MADSPFSGLDPAGTLTGAELVCLSQAGSSVRATLANVGNSVAGTIFIRQSSDWIANTTDLGGGRREALPNTSYSIVGTVTRAFTLVVDGTTEIMGGNALLDTDEYTGTGDMYEIPGAIAHTLSLSDIGSTSSNVAATWLNSASGSLGLFINACIINTTNLGTIGAFAVFCSQSRWGSTILFNTGFTLSNTTGTSFFFRDSGFNPNQSMAVTVFTLGASVYGDFRLHDNSCLFAANHKILDGLAGGANLGKAGFVTGNDFAFADDPLVGINVKDDPWNFFNNQGNIINSKGVIFLGEFDANDAIFPSSNPAVASSRNAHPILSFDDTTPESMVFSSVLPEDYDGGGVTVNIDWVAETAISGDVVWGVEVERLNASGHDIDSDSFAAQQTDTDTTAGTSGVISRSSISLTQAQADGWEAGDSFRLRISRVAASGSDTMVDDAQILRISLEQ